MLILLESSSSGSCRIACCSRRILCDTKGPSHRHLTRFTELLPQFGITEQFGELQRLIIH